MTTINFHYDVSPSNLENFSAAVATVTSTEFFAEIQQMITELGHDSIIFTDTPPQGAGSGGAVFVTDPVTGEISTNPIEHPSGQIHSKRSLTPYSFRAAAHQSC